MSVFNKFRKNIYEKKEQNRNFDISKPVRYIHADGQHHQYTPKNVKLMDLSHDKKLERIASLSDREQETFHLLLEGFTLKECAKYMGIKYSTVNTYTTTVYKKLGVNTRAELIINYRGETDE